MSDDHSSILAWSAGIAAGVVGLATLGYVLGPVGKPEKPPNQRGPQVGGAGGPLGAAGGPGAGGFSQEDLLRLLIQQQQMQQQQQKAQQTQQKQVEDQQMQQMQQQLLQQQLQKQQMQNILGQPAQLAQPAQPARTNALATPSPTPARTPSPLTSAPSPLDLQVPSPKDRFRQSLEAYRNCLANQEFDNAEKVLETMGQELDRNSDWMAACFECIRIYYGLQEWERCLNLSKNVLSHVLGSPLDLINAERLVHLVFQMQKAANKVDQPTEGLDESKKLLSLIGELLDQNIEKGEDVEDSVECYVGCASLLVLQKLRQLALWTELHRYAQEVQDKVSPLQPFLLDRIVEAQAGAFHQEGKTLDAITVLRNFYDVLKEKDGERKTEVISWCLSRMAKFHFYLDHFEESLELLNNLLEYHANNQTKTSLQDLVDLLSTYVELGDEEKIQEVVQQIRGREQGAIYSRSKYLITTDCSVGERTYKLNVKVCRAPPARKEGDADDDEDNYIRKLTNFFLEVQYENPGFPEDPLVTEEPVDHYDLDLTSPNFSKPASRGWYLVKMNIYKDGSKEELLGKHYQLLYKH